MTNPYVPSDVTRIRDFVFKKVVTSNIFFLHPHAPNSVFHAVFPHPSFCFTVYSCHVLQVFFCDKHSGSDSLGFDKTLWGQKGTGAKVHQSCPKKVYSLIWASVWCLQVYSKCHSVLTHILGERRPGTNTMKLTLMRIELRQEDGASQLSLTSYRMQLHGGCAALRNFSEAQAVDSMLDCNFSRKVAMFPVLALWFRSWYLNGYHQDFPEIWVATLSDILVWGGPLEKG